MEIIAYIFLIYVLFFMPFFGSKPLGFHIFDIILMILVAIGIGSMFGG